MAGYVPLNVRRQCLHVSGSAGLTIVANVAIATGPRFWGPRGPSW